MRNEQRRMLIELMVAACEDGDGVISIGDLEYIFPDAVEEARTIFNTREKGEPDYSSVKESDRNNYNRRHGGPWDRGSADSYYGRGIKPHYFAGATYASPEIVLEAGSSEYAEYMAGYYWNEKFGDKKDWG